MKKLGILFAGLFLFVNMASSQAVDDRAVIPVAVTLNSILRLNVTSGGNIEFNFNTLADYQNGIEASSAYQTHFNVASSVDWQVNMYSENATLIGTDIIAGSNTMPLNNIGYTVELATGATAANYNIPFNDDGGSAGPLTNVPATFIVRAAGDGNAGDITDNAFIIHWRCGTQEGTMRQATILSQGFAADRYATNVFLVLEPYDIP